MRCKLKTIGPMSCEVKPNSYTHTGNDGTTETNFRSRRLPKTTFWYAYGVNSRRVSEQEACPTSWPLRHVLHASGDCNVLIPGTTKKRYSTRRASTDDDNIAS